MCKVLVGGQAEAGWDRLKRQHANHTNAARLRTRHTSLPFYFHHPEPVLVEKRHNRVTRSMAGLEGLTAMIYHERQQEGSMLCAQHALNALLRKSRSVCILLSRGTDSLFDNTEGDYVRITPFVNTSLS